MQVLTGAALLVLGAIHLWVVLTDLLIEAGKSGAQVFGVYLWMYIPLILLVEPHISVALYQVVVKWGLLPLRWAHEGLLVWTVLFLALGSHHLHCALPGWRPRMTITTDVLVLGAGRAGERVAGEVASSGYRVIILSLVPPRRSQSVAARGGMQAALANLAKGEGDTTGIHFADTVKGSDWGCDQDVARLLWRPRRWRCQGSGSC